ncbi:tegument protein UL88 [Saimiriine betaherpesvirus 4]|uniref:Tegument protein UL88 n=1 Tax=Saimiriine betaherpesvirus 4 TaxID=1535247 RepID=G8XSZ3_9BETA|nr:tegument protein UL88 [Saimiriine betaherpesvirus 4]AEV80939.1 tegument protein UL88 [Saimiriine betaherpesvirus 4]
MEGWLDAALVLPKSGLVLDHMLENEGVSDFVRRMLPAPEDVKENCVFASELAFIASGRHGRRTSMFSIYWHLHSELIYALTGITYCVKIVIECGQIQYRDARDAYAIPGIYMIRPSLSDSGAISSRNVSWPSAGIRWPGDVRIWLVQRKVETFEKFQELLNRLSESRIEKWCPMDLGEKIDPTLESLSLGGTEFACRVSVAYDHLRAGDLPRTAQQLLDHCVTLAAAKIMLWLDVPRLDNFFLCQVCLYELGEDEVGEELIGLLHTKNKVSNPDFNLHRRAMKSVACLAFLLNCLLRHQNMIPELEERLNENDLYVIATRRYYRSSGGVERRTIAAGSRLLSEYADTLSVSDSWRRLNLPVPLDASFTREQLVGLLRT